MKFLYFFNKISLYIYIYIYIYIVLKKSNRMHKFLFYMANRFHVKKQFSKPLNVAFLC